MVCSSCCEWTGVMLSTVLDEVGASQDARWLLAEGADAAGLDRSVPIAKAYEDAMLAYAQNGERLRPEQGYPLRLFLPGFEGNMNVKWLRRLKLGDRALRDPRGDVEIHRPDAGRHGAAVHLHDGGEVGDHPALGRPAPHRRRGFHEISGLAWSGRGKIRAVDVSTDGGGELAAERGCRSRCWRNA